jgi:hypothetical protein
MEQFKQVIQQPKSRAEKRKLVNHISKLFKCPQQLVKDKINKKEEILVNDVYQVIKRRVNYGDENIFGVFHLSIKRIDKQPIHSWRELQQIKNLIVGKNHLGVEIYPNEDDLIDTANQYHLWVFEDPTFRMPFGFKSGRVVSYTAPDGLGITQESLSK